MQTSFFWNLDYTSLIWACLANRLLRSFKLSSFVSLSYPGDRPRSLRPRILLDVRGRGHFGIAPRIENRRLRHPSHGHDAGPSSPPVLLIGSDGKAGANSGGRFHTRNGQDRRAFQVL